MELLFERFLSEERGEWPDIDLDLPSGDQRERAIQYVYERYGKLGAAMTANVITYRGRSAAREVGKVLGFDDEPSGPSFRPGADLGMEGSEMTRPGDSFTMPDWIFATLALRNSFSFISRCRICRGIWASIPAAW